MRLLYRNKSCQAVKPHTVGDFLWNTVLMSSSYELRITNSVRVQYKWVKSGLGRASNKAAEHQGLLETIQLAFRLSPGK